MEEQRITIKNDFINAKEISEAVKALSTLTNSPEILIDVFVQGVFKIPNRHFLNDELNLDHGWYKVTKIGNKYLTVYVPITEKSFLVKPTMYFNRKPGFKLVAQVFNTLSFSY